MNTHGVTGKSFTRDSFPGNTVILQGQLTHSYTEYTTPPKIRVGIGTYFPVGQKVFSYSNFTLQDGQYFYVELCDVSILSANATYYLFVDNYLGSDYGYVSGDVGIYYIK